MVWVLGFDFQPFGRVRNSYWWSLGIGFELLYTCLYNDIQFNHPETYVYSISLVILLNIFRLYYSSIVRRFYPVHLTIL